MLKVTKQRHSVVVPNMARACRAMRKKYHLGMEEVGPNHSLTRAIQYCLDRLYLHRYERTSLIKFTLSLIFRISLNMLTRQHLMVYGHVKTVRYDHLDNRWITGANPGGEPSRSDPPRTWCRSSCPICLQRRQGALRKLLPNSSPTGDKKSQCYLPWKQVSASKDLTILNVF